VNFENLPYLVFRTIQGGFGIYCGLASLEKFNVSTAGVICSLMPLIVLVFATCTLNERVRNSDLIMVICIFTAVVLVIFGA
jgi:drug/metabolite transporter (DMT)-like permease